MDTETTRELIKNLPQIIGAVGIILAAYWAYKAKAQSTENSVQIVNQGEKQAKAIEVVRQDVNDKMQQLVETTARASHAEGRKEQLDETNASNAPMKVEIVEGPVSVKTVE